MRAISCAFSASIWLVNSPPELCWVSVSSTRSASTKCEILLSLVSILLERSATDCASLARAESLTPSCAMAVATFASNCCVDERLMEISSAVVFASIVRSDLRVCSAPSAVSISVTSFLTFFANVSGLSKDSIDRRAANASHSCCTSCDCFSAVLMACCDFSISALCPS
ncbi:hypothetical protein D9M70_483920 [compost metagenome]